MIATAHVLINVAAGKARTVYNKLMNLENVQHVDAIAGPYDLIATVQAGDFNAIGNFVINTIQEIEGVISTVTCNVIQFEP